MAKKTSVKRGNLISVVSFITLLIILASVFVLSGSFSDLVTTINKSQASQANAKITQSFGEAFKDESINTDKWIVTKTDGVSVTETASDNLRLDIPAGAVNAKARAGTLTFKELLKDNGDFRAMAVVYRPIATGDGMGVVGIRFSSKGADDDEAAVVRWQVNGTNSKAVFAVNGADGTRLETDQAPLAGNIAILRLDRINKKYRAFYKVGRDFTGDTGWKQLGTELNATLGNEGRISIFAHNGGVKDKFPKVVGKFDEFHLGWEGEPATGITFSDAFANGGLGVNWKVYKSDGAQVYENKNDNLILSLTSGGLSGKPRHARIVRTTPVVREDKNFALNTVLFKPTVVGEGSGLAGLGFVSTGNVDDEAANVRWVVSGTSVSKLVFVVRAPDGTLAEQASVNLDSNVKRVTLRLVRSGNKYAAFYRTGDSDTDFVKIGADASSNFGAPGHAILMVNNMGAGGKFPRVVGRFDSVSGNVSK